MKTNRNQLRIRKLLTAVVLVILSFPAFATDTATWNKSNEQNNAGIDHQVWNGLLQRYVVTSDPSGINLFRYAEVTDTDRKSLKDYLSALQSVDPRGFRRDEQMAYWINLYNALTIDLILENYPVGSIKKTGSKLFSFGPWDDPIANVAGHSITLNDIEHKILRPIWKDRRIHYAVNCASRGCPDLSPQAYTRHNLEAQLEKGAHDYVNHPRGASLSDNTLKVSSIYHWYAEDFGDSEGSLIDHLKTYADPDFKARLDTFSGSVDHDYDWSLNSAN